MVRLALMTTPELETQDPENAQAGREGYPGRWDLIRSVGAAAGVETLMVDGSASAADLVANLDGVEVIIPLMAPQGLQGNLDLMPLALARQLPSLRLVQVLSAGTNELDISGLAELGVTVANNGGANAISVAEHAVALMLSVNRRMMQQWETARRGDWIKGIDYASFSEVAGKTVGIVGFGNIGRQVARRLSGWGCDLIYYDTVELAEGRSGELGAEAVESLHGLLARSDIVTLHVPLLPSTRGLVGAAEFRQMQRHAVLINTCRGPVVDEAALVEALQSGQIAGAGLDVLEQEPTDSANPLLHMPNCVVTPHLAAASTEQIGRGVRFAIRNAARLGDGKPLVSVVAPLPALPGAAARL
eukprot:SAG22_NODE_4504_length_1249_cov_2.108696_1_plen_359_part_00